MPLAFRQWHLYRFDFMASLAGFEPTAFRLGEQITLCPTIPLHYIPLRFVSI